MYSEFGSLGHKPNNMKLSLFIYNKKNIGIVKKDFAYLPKILNLTLSLLNNIAETFLPPSFPIFFLHILK